MKKSYGDLDDKDDQNQEGCLQPVLILCACALLGLLLVLCTPYTLLTLEHDVQDDGLLPFNIKGIGLDSEPIEHCSLKPEPTR